MKKYNYLNLLSLEIQRQLGRVNHAVENGIAIVSDQNQLKAKLLELEMEKQTATHRKVAALAALEQWTGESIAAETSLVANETQSTNTSGQRPELLAFDAAISGLHANEQLFNSLILHPTISCMVSEQCCANVRCIIACRFFIPSRSWDRSISA